MLIAVFGFMVLVAVMVSVVASRATDRAVARNGADALALGALVGDANALDMLAHRNGIDDFSVTVGASDATASVTVGDMTAQASAQRVESQLVEAPAIAAVMARISQRSGRHIAYRVVVPDPILGAGQPSLTVDVPIDTLGIVLDQADELGLCRPDQAAQPTQFRLC